MGHRLQTIPEDPLAGHFLSISGYFDMKKEYQNVKTRFDIPHFAARLAGVGFERLFRYRWISVAGEVYFKAQNNHFVLI